MVGKPNSRRDFIRKGLLWAPAIVAPAIFIPKRSLAQSVMLRRRGGPPAAVAAGGGSSLLSGLVAYYKLDEGAAGNDAADTEGNTLTESGTGGVGSATGKIGNARDLEAGENDEFSHAEYAATDFTGDVSFTISCWVNFESVPATVMTIVGKYDSGANQAQYFLGKWDDGKFSFLTSPDGTAENRCNTVGTASTATWYHLRAGRDASVDLNFISLDNAAEVTVASTTIFNSTALLRLGRCLSGLRMDGLIDDVALWNRPIRTGTEADENFNRTTALK